MPISCDNVVAFSPPTLSVAAGIRNDAPLLAHTPEPIWVAHKPKKRKIVHNVFYDYQGFPDQSEEFDYLLHSVDGGPVRDNVYFDTYVTIWKVSCQTKHAHDYVWPWESTAVSPCD